MLRTGGYEMWDYTKEYDIVLKFNIDGEIENIEPYGEGHINSTFLITTDCNKYILQKINTNVFKRPEEVMANIFYVTEYLRKKGEETLNFRRTKDGGMMFQSEIGCYRLYEYIDDVVSYQIATDKAVFCNVGEAFGKFQNALADFDASLLHETISRFHDTPNRYENFENTVKVDRAKRLDTCLKEVQFVRDRKGTFDKIVKGISEGKIPLRVTHNDTKLNNILVDPKTKKARAVIDLDTVMPGSMLYDFGDSIRFGTNTAAEDEKNLDIVNFDIELFSAFAKGFCGELKDKMTDLEKELLPYSAYLMTMEVGMRFLTDYLEGDVYFATKYPEHNLVRCHTQFKLAYQMEQSMGEMKAIVAECLK